jgi:hypothetical protein
MRGLLTEEEFLKFRPEPFISDRYRSSLSSLPSAHAVRFQRIGIAVVGCLIGFCLLLFTTMPFADHESDATQRLVRSMVSFIHSQVANCTTARPVSESDLSSRFHRDPHYPKAFEVLTNTLFPDIDFRGDFWISLEPKSPLKCRIRAAKLMPVLLWNSQVLAAVLITTGVVAIASVIANCTTGRADRDAAFLVREMVRRSRAGAPEFDPERLRSAFGEKWSDAKWRSVCAGVERNPLICVLRGVQGQKWRVMWSGS